MKHSVDVGCHHPEEGLPVPTKLPKNCLGLRTPVTSKIEWHYISEDDLPKDDNKWYMVAMIYIGTNKTVALADKYIDNKFMLDTNLCKVYAWRELPVPPEVK